MVTLILAMKFARSHRPVFIGEVRPVQVKTLRGDDLGRTPNHTTPNEFLEYTALKSEGFYIEDTVN